MSASVLFLHFLRRLPLRIVLPARFDIAYKLRPNPQDREGNERQGDP